MRNEAESAVWRLLYPESQEAFQKVRRTRHAEEHWEAGESSGQLWQGRDGGEADTEIGVGQCFD